MRWFIRRYKVNMQEANPSDLHRYSSFNAFFTRALRADARPLNNTPNGLVCPVDGKVSQAGTVEDGQIFQAKGHHYALLDLLGGHRKDAAPFNGGRFATLYLSPRDYHRIHMPIAASLEKMIYVPGRLFSVAPFIVDNIPSLFARNERVAALFDTPAGKLAMILVGAINVAAIETVWAGTVTPSTDHSIKATNYDEKSTHHFQKGDEMGRFNMGSTVILLTESSVQFTDLLSAGNAVKMGELIGHHP